MFIVAGGWLWVAADAYGFSWTNWLFSFFPFPLLFSLLNRGQGKGPFQYHNNDSHANRLCSSHFSAFRSPKVQKRRQEKEKKESENGPKKNKNRNPYSEQRKEGGKGKGTRSKK